MSTMERVGNAIICREEMKPLARESLDFRWCFVCRKRREFFYCIDTPVGPSYYGPNHYIKCGTCGRLDADCFPGRYREWNEN